MNKSNLQSQLKKLGLTIQSLEFSFAGYGLELELNPLKGFGWNEFEQTPIDGLETVKQRQTSAYVRQVALIPASKKEFVDYIRRCCNTYGVSKDVALETLESIVEQYGSANAKLNLSSYLNKNKTKRND